MASDLRDPLGNDGVPQLSRSFHLATKVINFKNFLRNVSFRFEVALPDRNSWYLFSLTLRTVVVDINGPSDLY